jgi:hypothetical protein
MVAPPLLAVNIEPERRRSRVTWLASETFLLSLFGRDDRPRASRPRRLGRDYPSTALVRKPGCYTFEIAGSSFTRTIVFRAA